MLMHVYQIMFSKIYQGCSEFNFENVVIVEENLCNRIVAQLASKKNEQNLRLCSPVFLVDFSDSPRTTALIPKLLMRQYRCIQISVY